MKSSFQLQCIDFQEEDGDSVSSISGRYCTEQIYQQQQLADTKGTSDNNEDAFRAGPGQTLQFVNPCQVVWHFNRTEKMMGTPNDIECRQQFDVELQESGSCKQISQLHPQNSNAIDGIPIYTNQHSQKQHEPQTFQDYLNKVALKDFYPIPNSFDAANADLHGRLMYDSDRYESDIDESCDEEDKQCDCHKIQGQQVNSESLIFLNNYHANKESLHKQQEQNLDESGLLVNLQPMPKSGELTQKRNGGYYQCGSDYRQLFKPNPISEWSDNLGMFGNGDILTQIADEQNHHKLSSRETKSNHSVFKQ